MTRTRFGLGIAIGSIVILLAGNALADPTEVAEYKDPRSGDLFELYQEHDGSFFCSVQRVDGSLSGFEIEENRVPEGDGEACPSIRSIAKQYYSSTGRRDARNAPGRGEDGKPCPVCTREAKIEAENGIDQAGDSRDVLCCHRPGPDSTGDWKTVSLILLLMLSKQGAS